MLSLLMNNSINPANSSCGIAEHSYSIIGVNRETLFSDVTGAGGTICMTIHT
jgi:hypothetical protein